VANTYRVSASGVHNCGALSKLRFLVIRLANLRDQSVQFGSQSLKFIISPSLKLQNFMKRYIFVWSRNRSMQIEKHTTVRHEQLLAKKE